MHDQPDQLVPDWDICDGAGVVALHVRRDDLTRSTGFLDWIPWEGRIMKLLVADSDADLVEMLTSWLRTHGYQVTL